MSYVDLLMIALFMAVLIPVSVLLGSYMARVFSGERTFMHALVRPVEKTVYRLCGVDENEEMGWKRYAKSFVWFSVAGIVILVLIQMVQGNLPLNPRKLPGVRWDTALNTAISFVTNTNWQAYGGESTMSYLTQMAGLTVQNFLSSAAGIAVGLTMIRGFSRRESETVGNFWIDLTRSVLYVLVPLSVIAGIILLSQGVVQTFHSYVIAHTLEGQNQIIAVGPAASQIAIKQLGTNGGGFFNANSAHPFENPTMISNLVEMFTILIVPMGLVWMFGRLIEKSKQGRALFLVMLTLFIVGTAGMIASEMKSGPAVDSITRGVNANMEGKEERFGVLWSAMWAQSTTVTSNGSVNAMHDSFMPLSGLIQMFNMGIGEVIFGGVGVGLIGILFYVILSMFLAGLMIGRTPEFMGKKFGPYEMVMSMISLLLPMISLVIIAAIATGTKAGLSSLNNPLSHGLSEILYAVSSAIGNNGSAFAGLNANTVFYNILLSVGMLIGRFATILPALAVAGSLASKKTIPDSSATFPTTGPLFVALVVCVIFIMGALSFFPVYTLGPILEHLTLFR